MSTYITNESIYTSTTPYNALVFTIDRRISRLWTAIPVRVDEVDSGGSGAATGYVSATPLVKMVYGDNTTTNYPSLYHLPYFRLQGGVVAIVADPVPGDIGLAVFAQRDSSLVKAGTTEPVQPATFRKYDISDGFYIGGFLNQAPTCYLELNQDNTVTLNATAGVTINGDITVNGKITATGEIKGDGHSLSTHTHTGVHGETSSPNG